MSEAARRRMVFALLLLLAATGVSHAAFVRSFLTMSISINEDGSADVKKEVRFFMDSADSVDLYRVSLRTTNDLAGWRKRLGLEDIRYHIDTSLAPVGETKIQPQQPDTCNFEKTTCYGTFSFEFKVNAPKDGAGLINISRYVRPRISEYSLNMKALDFETLIEGEPYVPDRTSVEIFLPPGAINIRATPKPVEYEGAIPNGAAKVTWQGIISVADGGLVFERKETLLTEVITFFTTLQERSISWATSREGVALILAAIILVAGYYALQRSGLKMAPLR